MSPRNENDGPLVDTVSARLQGLEKMPEPTLEYPEDLPRTISGRDGATAVLVPAGFFWMGSHKEKKDEKPRRVVYLDSYYVDETPVTNGQYLQFLEKTGHRKPQYFSARRDEPDWEQHPVTFVSWDDAQAYAKWVLRRLPTEAEWEKAARGADGRIWPWGDEAPETDGHQLGQFGQSEALPVAVGGFPAGASPVGALDMAGGVWEWCQDQYDQFFYPRSAPRNPQCNSGDDLYRVARGGACNYSAFTARAAFRGWNLPSTQANCYGFRCVVDADRFRKKSAD